MKKAPSSIILFEVAKKRGYEPHWITEYGFFSFEYDGEEVLVYQTKSFGNGQVGGWLTEDKFATHRLLEEHGIVTIPYCFATDRSKLNEFFEKNAPLIAKPVLGKGAEDVQLITSKEDMFFRDARQTLFEKYIEGTEYRYLILRNEVIAVQEKVLSPTPQYPWKKCVRNLEAREYSSEMLERAHHINGLIPQHLLAVDFLAEDNGALWVLELNSMPSLWAYENPDKGSPIYISEKILDFIIESQLQKHRIFSQ